MIPLTVTEGMGSKCTKMDRTEKRFIPKYMRMKAYLVNELEHENVHECTATEALSMLEKFCRMNNIMEYAGHISHCTIARHRRYSSVKLWFADEDEPEVRRRVFEELSAFMESSLYRVGEFNGMKVT